MDYELRERQIALFFIAFLPITKFFSMPSSAVKIAGEDFYLSALLLLIIDLLAVLFLLKINGKFNADLFTILEYNFSKKFAKAVYFLYALFFTIKAVTPLFEQFNFLQTTLYETSPTTFNYLPFLIFSTYLCTKKLRAIGRLSDLLFAFSIISVILLTALAVNDVDFSAILPIGAQKTKIFKASASSYNWFGDTPYLLFMLGNFPTKTKNNFKPILGFIAHAIFTVGFLITFYAVFSYASGRELYAIAEISKYSNVLNSIGRFDYIAIFLLLIPHTVAVSLPIFFAVHLLNRAFNIKKLLPSLILNGAFFIFLTFFTTSVVPVLNFLHKYVSPFLFFMANVLPFALIFLKNCIYVMALSDSGVLRLLKSLSFLLASFRTRLSSA